MLSSCSVRRPLVALSGGGTRAVARRTAAVALVASALWAAPSAAHVGVVPAEPPAGVPSLLEFSFAHGCNGSPTERVTLRLPEQVLTATPQAHPGWTVEVVTQKLDAAVEGAHGSQVEERVNEVVFTARRPVPDGLRDTLAIQITPEESLAGKQLAFPVVQECEQGANDWVQVAAAEVDPHSLDMPAPVVTVGATVRAHGEADGDGSDAGHAEQTDDGSPAQGSSSVGVLAGAGLLLGAFGAVCGGLALLRTRRG